MTTRPKAFGLGSFRASVLRGPKNERWYWRVRHTSAGVEENRWTGWATLEEAQQVVADLVREGESKGTVSKTDTVLDLLEYWLGAQVDRVDLRPATIESCRQAVKRFKLGTLASVRVDRLDRRTLEAWRDGWAQARSERRERELQAHEAALQDGPCPDPDCPYPYCAESRERIAAVNAPETFTALVEQGQALRREFDAATRGAKMLTGADLSRRSGGWR